jgi:hypothetical protein
MPHASSKEALATVPAINRDSFRDRGWFSCTLATRGAATFRGQLMALLQQLGSPVATRLGGEICETLRPTDASCAAPHSLSRIYSLGEFPLHVDTAHWLRPSPDQSPASVPLSLFRFLGWFFRLRHFHLLSQVVTHTQISDTLRSSSLNSLAFCRHDPLRNWPAG